MEGSGDFGKKLGFLGNFGLVRSCTMEDPKTQYGLNEYIVWDDGWVGMYFIYMQELTEQKIIEYKYLKLKNN